MFDLASYRHDLTGAATASEDMTLWWNRNVYVIITIIIIIVVVVVVVFVVVVVIIIIIIFCFKFLVPPGSKDPRG